MTSDKTAIFGGVLILIGGLALAVYANTNANALSQSKAKTVSKYISLSEKALTEGKTRDAEKFAVKALTADPSNKTAISAFKKVALAGYTPASNNTEATPASTTDKAQKPAGQPQKPAPEEEAEEEMGCI